jgi:hypothetical protein
VDQAIDKPVAHSVRIGGRSQLKGNRPRAPGPDECYGDDWAAVCDVVTRDRLHVDPSREFGDEHD